MVVDGGLSEIVVNSGLEASEGRMTLKRLRKLVTWFNRWEKAKANEWR